VDAGAKSTLREAYELLGHLVSKRFPLEPIVCFVGREKMTSNCGDSVQFWAHRRLAREAFINSKLMTRLQFDLVAWEPVYDGLHKVPQMFQLWVCKQVWDIAGTNYPQAIWDGAVKKWCLSCRRAKETTAHVSQ
jgi:hypothetical protein